VPDTHRRTTLSHLLRRFFFPHRNSVTHNNVVTATNRDSLKLLWLAIKEKFASSQARIFNNFLYLSFKEDSIENFITKFQVSVKKSVDVGIDLPQDVLAYLILFKFPATLSSLKRQLMHSNKELTNDFSKETSTTEAALFSGKQGKQNVQKKTNQSLRQGNQSSNSWCAEGCHNPWKDENHSRNSCWHLHPHQALDWWQESQAKWKAKKEKPGKAGSTMPILGKVTVCLRWKNVTVDLEDCLYVPNIIIYLVSTGALNQKGCLVISEAGKFKVSRNNVNLIKGSIKDNLFTIDNPIEAGVGDTFNWKSDHHGECKKSAFVN
ncbi:hypothetical protein VP01_5635g1, partial [Puccinia sorghi]